MHAINEFLDTLSKTFGGSTVTGLRVVKSTQIESRIAAQLVDEGTIPATTADIARAYQWINGYAPAAGDLLNTEQFLLSFGWLA